MLGVTVACRALMHPASFQSRANERLRTLPVAMFKRKAFLHSSTARAVGIPRAVASTRPAWYDAPSAVSGRYCSDGTSQVLLSSLDQILEHYWGRCPTGLEAMELVNSMQPSGAPIFFDHFAFRTFGVKGMGIPSLSSTLMDFGYREHEDRLIFEKKKLKARWYMPPEMRGIDHALPRIFVSELEVEKLSPQAQSIICKYTSTMSAQKAAGHGLLASAMNSLPWQIPTFEDYETLAKESEYAAWVLVNGYALNHTTLTVHRFQMDIQTVADWNDVVKQKGIALNSMGGEEKISPDGGLRQSSTLADSVLFSFSCGSPKMVPGPYIEFAERRILPEYEDLEPQEIRETHRRAGFEASSADKIFESTSSTQ